MKKNNNNTHHAQSLHLCRLCVNNLSNNNMIKIKILFLAIALMVGCTLTAQVAINSNNDVPNGKAMLDVNSTEKGILIPRMTESQRDDIDPDASATGLMIYQTDGEAGFYYFNGSNWTAVSADPNIPTGTSPGQMQYWDGTAWNTVDPGSGGQTLRIVSGIPTWTFPDHTPPSVPAGLQIRDELPTNLHLDWDASADNIAVAGYNIKMNGVIFGPVVGPTYYFTGLSSSTSYDFSVQAFDVDGNESVYSASLYLVREPPSAPFITNVTSPSETSIGIYWTASAGSVEVEGYRVYQNDELISTVTELYYIATGLSVNTSYEYYVKAVDAAGNTSAPSNLKYIDREAPTGVLTTVQQPQTQGCYPGFSRKFYTCTTAADDVGVVLYKLYLNGTLHSTGTSPPSYLTNCIVGYANVCVTAEDAAGNVSDCN